MGDNEEIPFTDVKDKVQKATAEIIETTLNKKTYHPRDAQNWTYAVSEGVIKSISEINKNFKYMVTCVIMQKNDSGLNMASTCFWNSDVDGCCTVKWENTTILCIVNVFGVGL